MHARLMCQPSLNMYAQCLAIITAPYGLALLGNASCLTHLVVELSVSTQAGCKILCIAQHAGAALMQSHSGFASLPLPGSTNFEDNQELSLELGMRPCENLEPGLPCPALLRLSFALPCAALPCPALPCYECCHFLLPCALHSMLCQL